MLDKKTKDFFIFYPVVVFFIAAVLVGAIWLALSYFNLMPARHAEFFERDEIMPHILCEINSRAIDLSRCNECDEPDEGMFAHAG